MRTVYLLGLVMAAVGCASTPNATQGSSSNLWPGGSAPQLRMVAGVKYGQQGTITVMPAAPPLYAVVCAARGELGAFYLGSLRLLVVVLLLQSLLQHRSLGRRKRLSLRRAQAMLSQ